MLKHILFVLILVLGGYYFWSIRPITHGPGIIAPNEPVQQSTFGVLPITSGNLKFRPVASFDIEARVLSTKRYYGDQAAEYADIDIVVGWGPMSDERNLDKLLIKQSDRSYSWEMIEAPIPVNEMRRQIATLRPIASSEEIEKQLNDIRVGHVIRIKGYLVNVESDEGWKATTSLVRNDTGEDASEIVYVNELTLL